MTEAEIEVVEKALTAGKIVMWQPYSIAPALKVARIEIDPKRSESGKLLYLATGGSFLQMSHCDLDNFIVAERLGQQHLTA